MHFTVDDVALVTRDDIVLVPVADLPPLELGLIWVRAAENQRVRDLAAVARDRLPGR